MIITVDNAWPAQDSPTPLPLPFIDYTGTPRNQTIYSPTMAFGIERRSRFTRSYNQLSVTWHFNDEQYEAFKDFLTQLGNGAAVFTIELKFPLNSGLTEWCVRVEDSYQADFQDGIWVVQVGLELLYPVLIGEES